MKSKWKRPFKRRLIATRTTDMTEPKKRFSRATMLEELERRYEGLRKQYRFDPNNGWAQVEGKPLVVVVSYGRFALLEDLIEEFQE